MAPGDVYVGRRGLSFSGVGNIVVIVGKHGEWYLMFCSATAQFWWLRDGIIQIPVKQKL